MKDHELPGLALDAIRKSLPIDSWSKFADVIVQDRRKRQSHLVKSEVDRSWFDANESLRQTIWGELARAAVQVRGSRLVHELMTANLLGSTPLGSGVGLAVIVLAAAAALALALVPRS